MIVISWPRDLIRIIVRARLRKNLCFSCGMFYELKFKSICPGI